MCHCIKVGPVLPTEHTCGIESLTRKDIEQVNKEVKRTHVGEINQPASKHSRLEPSTVYFPIHANSSGVYIAVILPRGVAAFLSLLFSKPLCSAASQLAYRLRHVLKTVKSSLIPRCSLSCEGNERASGNETTSSRQI